MRRFAGENEEEAASNKAPGRKVWGETCGAPKGVPHGAISARGEPGIAPQGVVRLVFVQRAKAKERDARPDNEPARDGLQGGVGGWGFDPAKSSGSLKD